MLFPTISFAIFFALVFPLYWLVIYSKAIWSHKRANTLRKFLLLLASYFFYGVWDWRFLPLLLASTLLNYIFARILLYIYALPNIAQLRLPREIAKTTRKKITPKRIALEKNAQKKTAFGVLVVAVSLNLGSLIFFKYINWLLANLNVLLNAFGLPLLWQQITIALPLGISFFTFQNISFLADIYRRNLRHSGSYIDYSLYIAFFPQLIAGPIVRASNILPQLQRLPQTRNIYFSDALARILIGLVKKILIANTLSISFVDPVFLVPSAYSSLELLFAAYAYSAVIYCDFSAYSDMAAGLGLLCGIRLMENFDRPYARCSLQGFWRGWHISLSSWLRDYLYIPLGGNRNGNQYFHIIFTMLLGGLWHGASWTFLLWGLLHGVAISIEHWLRKLPWLSSENRRAKQKIWHSAKKLLGWFASFHFVTFSWILFRAPSFDVAGSYIAGLLNFPNILHFPNIVLITTALGILPQLVFPKAAALLARALDTLPILAQILLFAAGIAFLQVVLPESLAPFIYYQF